MGLHSHIEFQAGLLVLTASGEFEIEAALKLFTQACESASEKGISKILVDTCAVEGAISALERYRLGAEIAAYVKQRQLNTKVAIVGKAPTMNGFGVLVAQNRDLVTNAFSSQQEAMKWLDAWPG
jgi:hypothetical protein